jgi:uncharacterized protein
LLHPDTELRFVSPSIGWGVFATRAIPRGTAVWVRDELDQVMSPARVAAMPPLLQAMLARYSYLDARGETVLCWDHGRYVNHSCDPTCLAPGWDFEIAVRDIPAGAEITDDYATLGGGDDFTCECGAAACRRRILHEDFDRLADAWDARVAAAFSDFGSVRQPLWELIRERAQVEDVLAGRQPLPSIRAHRPPAIRPPAIRGG